MPTGTVTFTVDGTPQVPVTLSEVDGHAIASLTDSSLALGTHTITASYGGDSRFALRAAQSLTQVVGPITEIPISAPAADITSGPDGNLWYTVETDNEIGMIDPATGAVSEFAVPTPNSDLTNITTGSDGNLWFVESSVDQIGSINPATHAISEFSVPIPSIVTIPDVAPGPDGTLWLIVLAGNAGSGNSFEIFNLTTHAFTSIPIPVSDGNPNSITLGPRRQHVVHSEHARKCWPGTDRDGESNNPRRLRLHGPQKHLWGNRLLCQRHHNGTRWQPLVRRVRHHFVRPALPLPDDCLLDRDDQSQHRRRQ